MLAGIISQLVMNGMLVHSGNKAAMVKKEWGYIALAGISGVIALSFLTSALYMSLSALYSAPIAALLTGLVIGLVSLACLYMANRVERQEEVQGWAQQELAGAELAEKVNGLIGELEEPVKENPATAMVLATLAGFLAADRLN